MTISNIGSVAATQPNWHARKAGQPNPIGPEQKASAPNQARSGAANQPSLSDSLQSLLLGTQSSQAAKGVGANQDADQGATGSILQQLKQTLTKAVAAYGAA